MVLLLVNVLLVFLIPATSIQCTYGIITSKCITSIFNPATSIQCTYGIITSKCITSIFNTSYILVFNVRMVLLLVNVLLVFLIPAIY